MRKLALVWALVGVFAMGFGTAWAEDIVIVVNDNAPVQSLDAREVKEIYLGETGYWGDQRITPVGYQDGTPIQGTFLDKVVNISENVYKTYWIKRIFREGGVPPTKAGSSEEALRMVSQSAGGITYIPASALASAGGVREVFRVTN